MKLRLKAHHVKRYRDIARLFLKYGRGDVVQEFGLEDALTEDELQHRAGQASPEDLATDLEAMGPTFVKLGQILSSRPDLLPDRYLKALSRLQDQVKPFPFAEVEQIVMTEIGARISKAFDWFDPEPLASASLGQVHRATLRGGRQVVVKVQRPRIRQELADDLEVLEEIADFLDKHTEMGRRHRFVKILDEFRHTLLQELDYIREAGNLVTFAENLKEFPHLRIPQPVLDYTTRSVLTMDFIEGVKITSLSPLAPMEMPGEMLADELFQAYLKQVLVDGIFHADPHPGNVFITPDYTVALLDLGMVGRTSPKMQENLIKLLLAISHGNGDEAADLAIRISETTEDFQEAEFRHKLVELVAEQVNASLHELEIGSALLEVSRTAGATGLYVPSELTMLGKTLMQLDQIGKLLDPHFDPNAAIRRNVADLMNRKLVKNLSTGKVLGSLLEMKEFVGSLPTRLNKILDAIADAELEVRVRPTDVTPFLESFQKIANRITTGLILSALIIGASLLMDVQTPFTIFGYPGVAMIFFFVAAVGGLALVANILLHDYNKRRKPPAR